MAREGDAFPVVTIINFGFATEVGTKICFSGADPLELGWVAPELFGEGAPTSTQTDVFALGAFINKILGLDIIAFAPLIPWLIAAS